MEGPETHRHHGGDDTQAERRPQGENDGLAWPHEELDDDIDNVVEMARGMDRDDDHGNGEQEVEEDPVSRYQAWCLYASHALSMWNSRTYEFAAILFIQTAFPGDLMASSINGIAETVCVLIFQSALGRWLDAHPSRLNALLLTIHVNRLAVLLCCTTWAFILGLEAYPSLQKVLFGLVLLLGMCEKLARMTNTLAVERDWVPTMAERHTSTRPPGRALAAFTATFACWPSAGASSTPHYDLTHLNTVMRRIDMLCKLAAPLALSTFVATIAPVTVAVWIVASSNAASWAVEAWGIRTVWLQNARLQVPKVLDHSVDSSASLEDFASTGPSFRLARLAFILRKARASFSAHIAALRYFFSTSVWLPALVLALMHASVLSYSATLVVYLLNAGFPLGTITVARAGGAVFEIASTFVFPWAVSAAMRTREDGSTLRTDDAGAYVPVRRLKEGEEEDQDAIDEVEMPNGGMEVAAADRLNAAVVRVGLWGVCGLLAALIPVLFAVFVLSAIPPLSSPSSRSPPSPSSPPPPPPPSPLHTYPVASIALFTALSASFLGRWLFDLAATQLAQLLVPAARRAGFGGTEMALVGAISLAHWVAAAVWHRQADFRWLALASVLGVGVGGVAYGGWATRWRTGERGERSRRREG